MVQRKLRPFCREVIPNPRALLLSERCAAELCSDTVTLLRPTRSPLEKWGNSWTFTQRKGRFINRCRPFKILSSHVTSNKQIATIPNKSTAYVLSTAKLALSKEFPWTESQLDPNTPMLTPSSSILPLPQRTVVTASVHPTALQRSFWNTAWHIVGTSKWLRVFQEDCVKN